MKTFKLFAFIILLLSLGGQTAFGKQKMVKPTNEYQVLAEGSQSKVENPFVFIARDPQSYAQLQNLVEGLPALSTIDFTQNAVVAGFAGTRPTGGWTVQIRKSGQKTGVVIQSPGREMMVTQVITTAFQVSLVPVRANVSLNLVLAPEFIRQMKVFQVNKGDFEYSGGIAGRRQQFKANGLVRLLSFGDSATFLFELRGQGKERKRNLFEIASGTVKTGNFVIPRLEAGSFVEMPHPPFGVNGSLKNKILWLNFNTLPTHFADGYEGRGILEAVRIK